jgi:response regulator RpfG family c-di-GMP phosphodiesterase
MICKEYILCVDDERIVVQSLKQELKRDSFFGDINIEITDAPEKALDIVNDILSDGGDVLTIISDQRMPGITGDQLLLQLKEVIPETLGILLTGFSDLEAIVRLVNHNALYRYLPKPWDREDLLLTVRDACMSYRQQKMIMDLNAQIEGMTYALVSSLENANLFFDEETGNHVRRIAALSEFIGVQARLEEGFVQKVKLYSSLHDIGKVGIKKEVLFKPGRLTPEEFDHIKEHVKIGYDILGDSVINPLAKNIVLYHHEKWSGKGYLEGLEGESIPLEARIVSIADVFDALVNKRVYKEAMPVGEALGILQKERGVSFDPFLLDAFLVGMSKIKFPQDLYGSDF